MMTRAQNINIVANCWKLVAGNKAWSSLSKILIPSEARDLSAYFNFISFSVWPFLDSPSVFWLGLRHMVACCVAKKVARNAHVLFARIKILPISTSHILKLTELISTKFTYFMLYIYLTLHTKFDVDCTSGS